MARSPSPCSPITPLLSKVLPKRILSVGPVRYGVRFSALIAATSSRVPVVRPVRRSSLDDRLLEVAGLAEDLALRQLSSSSWSRPAPDLVTFFCLWVDVVDFEILCGTAPSARTVLFQPGIPALGDDSFLVCSLFRWVEVRHSGGARNCTGVRQSIRTPSTCLAS